MQLPSTNAAHPPHFNLARKLNEEEKNTVEAALITYIFCSTCWLSLKHYQAETAP